MNTGMPIAARRVFRLSLTMALALAGAYALALPLPYIAPIFALMLTAKPAPPIGLKGAIGLLLLVLLSLGTGVLLVPVLTHYPACGLLIVGLGLFLSNFLSINKGKAAVGSLLTVGLTLITAAGVASQAVALLVIKALVVGIVLALLCQRVAYLIFPEDPATFKQPAPEGEIEQSSWIALRATLIVFPAYLMALINPGLYMPIVMKSVSLGQQASFDSFRRTGMEMLGSTFVGGLFAVLFWFALDFATTLWMFFLWMLLFGIFFSAKLYRVIPGRHPASYWINVVVTLLILLGPAVQDSANGKDVYKAFAVRMSLYIAVTLYAWAALCVMEHLRQRRTARITITSLRKDPFPC